MPSGTRLVILLLMLSHSLYHITPPLTRRTVADYLPPTLGIIGRKGSRYVEVWKGLV